MDLAGKTIANYQLVQEIGRGGMAVVYRAYQPSLNRYVAIKVLPPQLSFDQHFVTRFQREARAAARLRHPNIVVIHDVGHHDGIYYIVMEYLEGRTLGELIQQEGALPPARAAQIVEETAAALDYAHQQGFVHRDVKPANIFVGEGDRVTLTDFGIAKAASETQQLTRTGMLIGTPEYMSPEQAEGASVDHRTDLYALGVVLYQMLTGRVPFHGTTPHATLHAIIYQPPPPPRQIMPSLSAAIESVILKALAKLPAQRFQSGKALASALQQARAGTTVQIPDSARQPPESTPTSRIGTRPLVIAIAVIAFLLIILIVWFLRSPRDESSAMTTALARDATGTAVALLSQTQTATASADDGFLTAEANLRATEAALKATADLLDARSATETAEAFERELVTLTAEAIEQEQMTATAQAAQQQATMTAAAEATLTAAAEVTGTFTPTPTHTPTDTPTPTATPKPAPPKLEAKIVFSGRVGDAEADIYTMNPDGSGRTQLTYHPAGDTRPDWSPDGRFIAFHSDRNGNSDIYVISRNGENDSLWQITTHPGNDYDPTWSADGKQIAFMSDQDGNREIYVMNSDGSGVRRLTNTAENERRPSWSPQGQPIAFESARTGESQIFAIQPNGQGEAQLTHSPGDDISPRWSPDGARIVFASHRDPGNNENRWPEIYVMGRAGNNQVRLTSNNADDDLPAWSPDGRWIIFSSKRHSCPGQTKDRQCDTDLFIMRPDGSEVRQITNTPNVRENSPVWWGPN